MTNTDDGKEIKVGVVQTYTSIVYMWGELCICVYRCWSDGRSFVRSVGRSLWYVVQLEYDFQATCYATSHATRNKTGASVFSTSMIFSLSLSSSSSLVFFFSHIFSSLYLYRHSMLSRRRNFWSLWSIYVCEWVYVCVVTRILLMLKNTITISVKYIGRAREWERECMYRGPGFGLCDKIKAERERAQSINIGSDT